MAHATAQFFAGTKNGKSAFLDYNTGESNILPPVKQKIQLHDIRALTPQPELQTNGFQKIDFYSSIRERDFISAFSPQPGPSANKTTSTYFQECEDLVRSVTGASEVVAFHHRYRHQNSNAVNKVKAYTTTPVPDIHIDNDATTAHTHLIRNLSPSEVSHWETRHWAIINVWRPVAPVYQMPLALLDPSSIPIDPTSLAEPVYTRSNYKSHIRGLRWHSEYKFCYVSQMQPDEALLFVDFDSERTWRLGGVAHGAVQEVGKRSGKVVPPRKSVEVRCLVLYD